MCITIRGFRQNAPQVQVAFAADAAGTYMIKSIPHPNETEPIRTAEAIREAVLYPAIDAFAPATGSY